MFPPISRQAVGAASCGDNHLGKCITSTRSTPRTIELRKIYSLEESSTHLPVEFSMIPESPRSELTPEFIAYTNGPNLLAQVAPIYAIAAAIVIIRCHVRAFILKSFRGDDWTMVMCLVCAPAPDDAGQVDLYFSIRSSQQHASQHTL